MTFDPGIGKAKARATGILDEYGLRRGGDADLENLAYDRGLLVASREMTGAEGRLVRKGKQAIATINDGIYNEGKRNFVVAHEFGHFELHEDSPLFLCDESDFVDWHRHRPEETEANQFAAELLMPRGWFIREASAVELSIEEVSRLAELCGVSLTAAAFRCVELDVTPSALAFCQDNEIKWSNVSDSFPYQYIRGDGEPDGYSGAWEYFGEGIDHQDPIETPADAWFGDYDISEDDTVIEQCLVMSRLNATLSLIWQV
ncbi:MAG: ImmA/IrrE family metallo-endopeptidase [Salinibacter sp.]